MGEVEEGVGGEGKGRIDGANKMGHDVGKSFDTVDGKKDLAAKSEKVDKDMSGEDKRGSFGGEVGDSDHSCSVWHSYWMNSSGGENYEG